VAIAPVNNHIHFSFPLSLASCHADCVYDLWLRNKLTDLSLSHSHEASVRDLPYFYLFLSYTHTSTLTPCVSVSVLSVSLCVSVCVCLCGVCIYRKSKISFDVLFHKDMYDRTLQSFKQFQLHADKCIHSSFIQNWSKGKLPYDLLSSSKYEGQSTYFIHAVQDATLLKVS